MLIGLVIPLWGFYSKKIISRKEGAYMKMFILHVETLGLRNDQMYCGITTQWKTIQLCKMMNRKLAILKMFMIRNTKILITTLYSAKILGSNLSFCFLPL